MFPSEVSLLLLVLLPSSKGTCCNRLNISLSGRAAHNHPEVSGIYVKDSIGLNDRPAYSKITGSGTWKIVYIGYWIVYKIHGAYKPPRVKEAIFSRAACPIHINWQYFCWSCRPQNWVKDSTILVKCEKENFRITKETTSAKSGEAEGSQTKVIIGGVGGGFIFIVVILVLGYCLWKSRKKGLKWRIIPSIWTTRANVQVDDNPVYMDDYADPYTDNEIYDRNAYYAAEDMEDAAVVSTMARDQNPEYETCL